MITCKECGKEFSDQADKCPNCGCPIVPKSVIYVKVKKEKGVWSTGRLTIGIISIIFFLPAIYSSLIIGIMEESDTSLMSGFFLAIMLLTAGIVGICSRNSKGKGGAIACTIMYWLGAILTIKASVTYVIWDVISYIFGTVFLISAIKTKKSK